MALLNDNPIRFICEQCHKIYDLPTRPIMTLEGSVQAETGHQVRRHTMEFYGLCQACAEGPASGNSSRQAPKQEEKTE